MISNYFDKNLVAVFLTLSITILLVVIGFYILYFHNFEITSQNEDWGNFGSFVGGVAGALFSFLTILLLVVTFKKQNESFKQSQFESSFFEMLRLNRNLIEKIEYKDPQERINRKGLIYIDYLSEQLNQFFSTNHISDNSRRQIISGKFQKKDLQQHLQDEVNSIYKSFYKGKESILGHYFRSLYHILKFVEESEISNKEKYSSFVQAFLTDSELHILFYNGISDFGIDKFHNLIDKFSLLENIKSKGEYFDIQFENLYPKTFPKYEKKRDKYSS
ncbi:MAG: hypothetical protein JJ971_10550 [Balneolaceae bacterium]|nr:hypothetical protein [Balneolaceae bacterium]MBO6546315.1 hypothetical protein [Balneolaceae bacterium]MBO6648674.1 hypothetical protein [Balneolaceae bacterium]